MAEQEYWDWVKKTYGLTADDIWDDAALMNQLGSPNSEQYKYWQKYIQGWGFKWGNLPKNITSSTGAAIPVNYAFLASGKTAEGRPIEIYAPTLPLESLSASGLMDIAKNSYKVYMDDGSTEQATLEDLEAIGALSRNMTTGEIDLTPLYQATAYPLLAKKFKDQFGDLSADEDAYLQSIVKTTPPEKLNADQISGEIGKMRKYPEYVNIMRATGRLGGELPEWWAAADVQKAKAMQGAFGISAEEQAQFPTEKEALQAKMKQLSSMYKEWKPKFESGIYTPTELPTISSQFGAIGISEYESAKKRLEEIAGGATPQITNVPPETSAQFAEAAKQMGIEPSRIASTAQQFVSNPNAPEWASYTGEQRATLANLGNIVESQGQIAQKMAQEAKSAEQKRWESLVKRAKQPQYTPERMVRI